MTTNQFYAIGRGALCALVIAMSGAAGALHAQPAPADVDEGSGIEIYSLLNFDFDDAEPGPTNRRILQEYVYGAIRQGSRVTVIGYTDVVGEEDRNKELSERRARAVATLIERHVPDVDIELHHVGLGETTPLFDNRIPEGRFHNRTVVIVIEHAAQERS